MVSGKHKSRSLRRVYVKTTSGKVKIHYRRRKPGIAKCGICGKPLHGIPRMLSSKFRNLAKTKKRPQRMYGGNLCSKCSRQKIMEKFEK